MTDLPIQPRAAALVRNAAIDVTEARRMEDAIHAEPICALER